MAEATQGGFLGGLGQTLLHGLRTAIDGEALQRYGTYQGQVVQDPQGNSALAGTPFSDTLEDVARNPINWVLIGAAVILGVVLIKRL
jgi:hypothetical protein